MAWRGMSSTVSIMPASSSLSLGRHRREGHAAIAEQRRGDAVPAHRRAVRIPADLRIEMGVDVDEARRDGQPVGVDLAPALLRHLADRRDLAVAHRDVAREGSIARSVDDATAADD